MSDDLFIGPLPYPEIPEQPVVAAPHSTLWGSYDVPRIKDILSDPAPDVVNGRIQVDGFRYLHGLLLDHYRRLKMQHAALCNAWQSPTAEEVLSRVDSFATALLSEAHCATKTARALDDIHAMYFDARIKVAGLEQEWNNVTRDWVPEWWDHTARDLNKHAQQIAAETDRALADYRTNIIIPRLYEMSRYKPPPPPDLTATASTVVPPIPGYPPIETSGNSGPELASIPGAPQVVPAAPGQPVSMLPIPPGNQHAPYGGAYILPGPGVGRSGYVVPMPQNPGGHGGGSGSMSGYGAGRPGVAAPGATAGSGVGMMPMAMGTGTPQGGGSAGGLYRRNPDTTWQVEKGVPPLIEAVGDDVFVPDQPSQKQEDAFKEWFAELAYPWRSNNSGSEPHVILRKVDE